MFLCSCAGTLTPYLDLAAVARRVGREAGVEVAAVQGVLCAPDGRAALAEVTAARRWDRVVIGACTPEEHGAELRAALAAVGVNPFLVVVANLREQCAWVSDDPAVAVEKACSLVAAGVARVRVQQPLEIHRVPACTGVAVVGGGAAGIAAAMALADGGREVVLVEREPFLGGRVYRYEQLTPGGECGACRLAPTLDEVLHHPRIEVLTDTTVTRCRGREGDFRLELVVRPRGVAVGLCLGCGACTAACPVTVPGGGAAIRSAFDGALPAAPVVDPRYCRVRRGVPCDACVVACPTGAARPGTAEQILEREVGAVVLATGLRCFDPAAAPRFGYSGHGRVWTAPELERCLAEVAAGKDVPEVGGAAPARVALVHCVGSRSALFHPHCSGICCAYLGKHAAQLAALVPGVAIVDLYVDHCLPGQRDQPQFRASLAAAGVELRRRRSPDEVEVLDEGDGVRVRFACPDGTWDEVAVDLAVLAPALLGPEDAEDLAQIFAVDVAQGGWFAAGADLLECSVSSRPGVVLACCCRAPGGVEQAVADGLAAAGQVFRSLVPGRTLELDPEVAVIDAGCCSGCGVCRAACAFGAVSLDAGRVAVVDETLCRGCGSCAAACPVGAVAQRQSTAAQLRAEIVSLLAGGRAR